MSTIKVKGKPLDYQQIRENSVITLKQAVLRAMGGRPLDWISVHETTQEGVIIIKLRPAKDIDVDSIEGV